MRPIILSIAGSDSSGGAGIQADIKTITVQGGYAASVITAVTAQNTLGVQSIYSIPDHEIIAQICSVKNDLEIQSVKTGMLTSKAIIEYIATEFSDTKLVVDPVMVATSGDVLIGEDITESIKSKLLPVATLVTPNIYEAEILTGIKINNENDQIAAAEKLIEKGCKNVLVKGGHGKGNKITDVLISGNTHIFKHEKISTNNTHGTGCTLASSIATKLAFGDSLRDACNDSIDYILMLLKNSPKLGKGNGPLIHNLN